MHLSHFKKQKKMKIKYWMNQTTKYCKKMNVQLQLPRKLIEIEIRSIECSSKFTPVEFCLRFDRVVGERIAGWHTIAWTAHCLTTRQIEVILSF